MTLARSSPRDLAEETGGCPARPFPAAVAGQSAESTRCASRRPLRSPCRESGATLGRAATARRPAQPSGRRRVTCPKSCPRLYSVPVPGSSTKYFKVSPSALLRAAAAPAAAVRPIPPSAPQPAPPRPPPSCSPRVWPARRPGRSSYTGLGGGGRAEGRRRRRPGLWPVGKTRPTRLGAPGEGAALGLPLPL